MDGTVSASEVVGRGRLAGRRCVITGVGKSIGRAIAISLCDEGARVVGVGRSEDDGRRFEAEMRAAGRDFRFVGADVSVERDVGDLAVAVMDWLGGVDVIVNNAGVAAGKPLLDTTDDEWDAVLTIGPRGTFLVVRELGRMLPASGGSIINIASSGGLVALPNMAAYCASKGAVVAMTRSMAVDLAPETRVNALCPDAVDGSLSWETYADVPGMPGEEVDEAFAAANLAERSGEPVDVASFAVFLASDESRFVTGGVFTVDGGFAAV